MRARRLRGTAGYLEDGGGQQPLVKSKHVLERFSRHPDRRPVHGLRHSSRPCRVAAAKREALGVVNSTIREVAKGKFKEATEAVIRLGIKAGPAIVNTQAYEFFKNLPQ